ncbi:MAG: LytTR family DNA-binding domain-containing protein [Gemmataceae bacterium]|nr:LytTR family DNA-binding domain-containing protein [Gemmataceae bacterium]MCI0737909.1 LytTR family DNA-binding domain-containing protein [Gemmataceae bacterium]
MKIRTLIVDDEPLARQRVRALLEVEPDIDIIGECGDGGQAAAQVRRLKPDLMFLDVQMPVLDGFGVLEELQGETLPVVVFVTAHDRFALKAFEVHALDYLLKPFDRERFAAALNHAKAQIRNGQNADMEKRLLAMLAGRGEKSAQRLVVKSAGRVYFVRVADIDWIEAAGNYVRLHVGKQDHLLRESMGGPESKLDPNRFVRIHRSVIVNIERIRELQPAFHGDYAVVLQDGTELTLSRSHREKLQETLGHSL